MRREVTTHSSGNHARAYARDGVPLVCRQFRNYPDTIHIYICTYTLVPWKPSKFVEEPLCAREFCRINPYVYFITAATCGISEPEASVLNGATGIWALLFTCLYFFTYSYHIKVPQSIRIIYIGRHSHSTPNAIYKIDHVSSNIRR